MNPYSDPRRRSPSGGGNTRPNARPQPTVRPQKPAPTYRARPASGGSRPADVMSQRAVARLQSDVRRRRLRFVLITVVALIMLAGATGWAVLQFGLQESGKVITEIFKTPAPRPTSLIPGATPIPTDFPTWTGKDPVNILLIGLDYRPEQEDTRADTQIIVHIDPRSKSVSMLSIPRDLWLPIPGEGENRVNAAYQIGESQSPGSGPGLAMATIEQNFGIRIHYYAQVDFKGFERIVDTMGGVTIDVPKPLVDNEYPFMDYGFTRIYVPGGLQHMDGKTALQYARSRHADSDLFRNYRQQQVLIALRNQGINLNLISKLGELANELSDAVKTDLNLMQVGQLAQLAREIDPASIHNEILLPPAVYNCTSMGGADVLCPDWDVIRPIVARTFADPRLAKEAARLSVQNGTTVGGMARKLSDQLVPKGFIVADLSSAANQGSYPKTTIIDYTGGKKPFTLERLTELLDIPTGEVQQGDPSEARIASDGEPVDITIIVGDDRLEVQE